MLCQFVGLGSALSMGLDTVENSLLTEQPDCTLNCEYSESLLCLLNKYMHIYLLIVMNSSSNA